MKKQYIYAIGTNTNRQKIGFSNNPEKRLIELQTGNSEELFLHNYFEYKNGNIKKLEKLIHQELSHKRLKGEWFNLTKDQVVSYIEFFKITYEDKIL